MKNPREDHALYVRGVQYYLAGDNRGLRTILRHPDLLQDERSLLKARSFIKKNLLSEAETLLESLAPSTSFLKAERHFILANVASFRGRWEQALNENITAFKLYDDCCDQRGRFLSSYNQCVDYEKLGRLKDAESALAMSANAAVLLSEKSLVERAKACFAMIKGNFEEAKTSLLAAKKMSAEASPLDQANLLMIESDLLFRTGLAEESFQLLKKLMNDKRLKEKGRIQFYYYLTGLYLGKLQLSDLRIEPKSLVGSEEYAAKWKLFKSITSGDVEEAQQLWDGLAAKFPLQFSPEFLKPASSEESNAFFKMLDRFGAFSAERPTAKARENTDNKLSLLVSILSESKMPLRKEYLIEKIWGGYDPAWESRFYRLISRARNQGFNISNSQRAYQWIR